MHQIAKAKGGKCLSDKYINARMKLLWECAEGHRWETTPDNIKQGKWCPICAGIEKLTIEEMQKIAEDRDGKCLSDKYVNAHVKLFWKCKEGHKWTASAGNVKSGSWCPKCGRIKAAEKLKSNIKEMQRIAEIHDGRCLSKEYTNTHTKLLWECKYGHQWEAVPSSTKQGHWCPICRRKEAGKKQRLTIEEMHQIAKDRKGKCLSHKYIDGKTKLLWECEHGHQWEATPNKVKHGTWCLICGHIEGTKKRSLDIETMQRIAEKRGGKCLSQEYKSIQTNLLWECKYGHQWKTRPTVIKRGGWCPECTSGSGERICKEFFEQIFKKKFSKSYPKWLVNESGNRMELDGYCRSLKIAFEHQGKQHYSTKTHFISTQKELLKRKRDDKRKKEICKNRGILLIQIPEVPAIVPIEKIKKIIKRKCKINNIRLPDDFDSIEIDLYNVYTSYRSAELLIEFKKIAEKRNGNCLSQKYINSASKLKWECEHGHQWKALPGNIIKGHWCPKCSGREKLTIQEMYQIAKEREGKCLSREYVGANHKLKWECKYGHQWEARPSNIKSGIWCPKCGIKKSAKIRSLTIEEMHQIAENLGGKCISEKYINIDTKLLWECEKGHQWWAIPWTVKKGHWCPICAGNIKLTIEDMRKIAIERGGKCLSQEYVNTHTKLLWQCENRHQWTAIPSNIKRGRWCPVCYKQNRRKKSDNN